MSPTATAPSGPNRQSLEGDRGATTTVCAVRACRAAPVQFTGAPLRLFVPDRSRGPFTTGDRQLLFPSVMREGVFAWAGGAAGILAVRGGVPDQVRLRGRPAAPQRAEDPAHDALAASLFFITPALENLDVAFQGLNTWHSFQYKAHGMIGSATVARFAARGWGLYAVGIGLTAACAALYLALRGLLLLIDAWPGDVMQQRHSSSSASTASSPRPVRSGSAARPSQSASCSGCNPAR